MNWLFRKNEILRASRDAAGGMARFGKMVLGSDDGFLAPGNSATAGDREKIPIDKFRPPGIIKHGKGRTNADILKYVENCETSNFVFVKKPEGKKEDLGYERRNVAEMETAYIPSDIAADKAKAAKQRPTEKGTAEKAQELVKDAKKRLGEEIKVGHELFSAERRKSMRRFSRISGARRSIS